MSVYGVDFHCTEECWWCRALLDMSLGVSGLVTASVVTIVHQSAPLARSFAQCLWLWYCNDVLHASTAMSTSSHNVSSIALCPRLTDVAAYNRMTSRRSWWMSTMQFLLLDQMWLLAFMLFLFVCCAIDIPSITLVFSLLIWPVCTCKHLQTYSLHKLLARNNI